MVVTALVVVGVAGEGRGLADPPSGAPASSTVASAPSRTSAHAIYVELLGKGGLWGLGYDYQFHPRVGVGAAGSYYVLDGQRVLDFSPYLVGYVLGTHRHRWFLQGGPQFSYVQTPSPVPEWPGSSTTGVGAELCSGYEYRHGFLLRLFGMVTVGKGGTAPWMGISLGWSI